jgi:hypothetical protein
VGYKSEHHSREHTHATLVAAGIGNVLRACTASGLLATFQDMDAKLERIQKSLDNYLENKRQQVGLDNCLENRNAM